MIPFYSDKFKLGILGGGQLGRMFIQEAANLDVNVYILDPEAHAPSSKIAHHFEQGSITEFESVYNFGKDKNVVTIEIEHVNVEALLKLEYEGVQIYPQPILIQMVQDKGSQKEFYQKHAIPTADFRLIENAAELTQHLDFLPCVQKLRRGGYDGKGVQVLRTTADLTKAFDAPSVLEKFVDFEKELSVIVARNVQGDIKSFPVVELEFNPEANLVEFLFSPADISLEIETKAQAVAQSVIEKMQMVGVLAVEMFLTKSGEILVNEIAPRPHNSGHQTIEGSYTSQYEQHLRAILGLPLGSTDIILPSVMLNLLGEKNYSGNVVYQGLTEALAIKGVYPHIYGKTTTKSFRKMGHVTVLNESLHEAKIIAEKVKQMIRVIA
ncbi:MAG: 5-(carboxyamino)imidazole ribonucleotide synthase [Crocinitomicaceae bacterium]|nr:5-(carboxyamino)imidazole ribonucleotide synthase [Crocinitomicaceae bacterium]